MRSFITLLPFAATAVLAAPTTAPETLTIWNYSFRGNNASPEIHFSFTLPTENVTCSATGYAIPSAGMACSDSAYSFDILGGIANSEIATKFRLYHSVSDGSELAGDFTVGCNGPLPSICDQVGTSEVTLTSA